MNEVIPVSAEWLARREGADERSRSRALVAEVTAMMAPPVVVHDLGSGTGSMMRWLARRLPGPQTWVLHDWNPELLAHAVRESAADRSGQAVVARTNVEQVALMSEDALAGASLITASALLDVLTLAEIEAIVRACLAARAPALFSLSVTGRVRLNPDDAGDRVFEAAFNEHQRRADGGRRLLGPDAVETAAALFAAAGWSVRIADTPWLLDASDRELLEEWLHGWVTAAVEARGALREWAEEYLRTRGAQVADSSLRVRVDHRDLLAWPR